MAVRVFGRVVGALDHHRTAADQDEVRRHGSPKVIVHSVLAPRSALSGTGGVIISWR
jgi:hypothetical protein